MQEIHLNVVIDPELPRSLDEPVVALGDFYSSDKVIVYQAHPEELGQSILQQFYRDLIFGRPLPVKLVTREIADVDQVVLLALFLDRTLAIHPATAAVVFSCDLARFGPAGLAHVDRDLARFISFVRTYLGSKEGRGEHIKTVVRWVGEYIREGSLPALPPEPRPPRILDVGTNGFVVAEAEGNLVEGWTELYRVGHLRGVLFGPATSEGYRMALGARKSHLVDLDLGKAAAILNEAERAMGEFPEWSGEDLWLWGPEEGTLLLPTHILEVLVRV